MSNILTLILAGGQGERLSIFSLKRAKPAVPFAGKYRIIDFALSNCVNSGFYDVAVLTQYRPRSLNDHIGNGRPWDLDRDHGGVTLLQPYLGLATGEWYSGTADAVYQNLYFVQERRPDITLILGGDHIYKMDYRAMIRFHQDKGADVTVGVMEVPIEQASRFGILTLNAEGRVVDFVEKPPEPRSNLVSMGIYVFNSDILARRLREDAGDEASAHDFGRNVVPRMVKLDRVFGYPFLGYWQDVGTVQSYWEANMDLLEEPAPLDLYDRSWRIHTRSEERGPAKLVEGSRVERSLLCHGCVVAGTVIRSVLSPGVEVAPGALVRDSIVMTDSRIGPGAVLDRCILDKEVEVGAGARLGVGEEQTPNWSEPARLNTGLTVVGKGAKVPAELVAGRNVKIGPGVRERDYPSLSLASGESVGE